MSKIFDEKGWLYVAGGCLAIGGVWMLAEASSIQAVMGVVLMMWGDNMIRDTRKGNFR